MDRQQGDFEDFCRTEYAAVFKAALGFCGDPEIALDASQEAFARAFARWSRLRRHEWAGGWVMTTALNLCKRSLRQRPIPPTKDVDQAIPDDETRLDVVGALRTLPLRQRQAVLLHYLADLPVRAVADLMHTSEGTVKTHLSRARHALKGKLRPEQVGGTS